MDVSIENSDDHVVCRPYGEIEAHNVDDLRLAVGAVIDDHLLVIDLSEVAFIDSAGLGCLIGTIRRVRDAGGDVGVVSTKGHLTRILRSTGFDRIVPVEESVVDAVAAVRKDR